MKTKILTKVISSLILVSTVVLAPGFASAFRPKLLGNKRNRPQSSAKEQETGNNHLPSKFQSGGSGQDEKSKSQLLSKDSKSDKLLCKCFLDDDEKKELQDMLKDIAKSNASSQDFQEKVHKIIDKLLFYVLDTENKEYVLDLTFSLIERGFIGQAEKNKTLKILKECADLKDFKTNIAMKISSLYEKDPVDMSSEQGQLVVDILKRCADDNAAKKYIALAFENFINKDFSSKCSKNDISKIVDLLGECMLSFDARKNVMCAIDKLIKSCHYGFTPANVYKEKIPKMLDMFCEYEFDGPASKAFFQAVLGAVHCDFLDESPKAKILKMLDKVGLCVVDAESKQNFAEIVHILVYRGLLDQCSQDEFLKIVNILSKCADVQCAKKTIVSCVFGLIQCSKKAVHSKEGILKVVNVLTFCVDDKESGVDIAKTLNDIFLIASKNKDFNDKKFTKDEVPKILNLLDKCSDISCGAMRCFDDVCVRKHVVDIIGNLNLSGFLKECSVEDMLQITDILNKCANSQHIRTSVAVVLACLFNEDWPEIYSQTELESLLETVEKCQSDAPARLILASMTKMFLELGWT